METNENAHRFYIPLSLHPTKISMQYVYSCVHLTYNKEATGIGQNVHSMSQGSGLPYAIENIPELGLHGYQ